MKNYYRKMYRIGLQTIMSLATLSLTAQQTNYGTNDAAGKYVDVGDTKIYYETYGKGEPLLLLHGGMFGYIDEYADKIPTLEKTHRVIAIATRGHGKSGIGTAEFSYELFADDAAKVLEKESTKPATIIGFSDGAITSYLFVSKYPEKTKNVISMAGGFGSTWFRDGVLNYMENLSGEGLLKGIPDFVKGRKALMHEPERWNEFIDKLNAANMQEIFITDAEATKITCPVLLLGGDRDDYFRIENFIHAYQTIPNAQLAIIPNCAHVDLMANENVFKSYILPFLVAKETDK